MFLGGPSGCPSVRCPFTPISRDVISLYLVEIAEYVFKVTGQRSRSRPELLIYNDEGMRFDSVLFFICKSLE